MTICFFTASSVPGGSELRRSCVRVTRSHCAASMPAASKTLSKSTAPPGAAGGGVVKTFSSGVGGGGG